MRIALVSEHANPLAAVGGVDAGGQNVHVEALSRALARIGHDLTVYTRRDDPDLPDRVDLGDGTTVEHLTAGPHQSLPKDELLPHMRDLGTELARRLAADPPDMVHAHFWMSGLASVAASAAPVSRWCRPSTPWASPSDATSVGGTPARAPASGWNGPWPGTSHT